MKTLFDDPEDHEITSRAVPIDRDFPEAEAGNHAKLESYNKNLYRPNTYLHKWWARRSGTTFRYILKQLVPNPAKRDFYTPGGLEGKIVLDPMMGGGTTIHEAIRMGANVIGVDIDPVPVLQVRASLQGTSSADKTRVFREFFRRLRNRLAPLFQTSCPWCDRTGEIQFTLYGLRRKCSCREVILIDSYSLRDYADGASLILCSKCGQVHNTAESHRCEEELEISILSKDNRECGACGSPFAEIEDCPYAERYRPLVTVGWCPAHGQFFKAFDNRDKECCIRSVELARAVQFGSGDDFRIPNGPKSNDLLSRGIASFLELFTPRQLLYMHYCRELVQQAPENDRLWLSLLISTSLEFNSILCGYKGVDKRRPGAIRHVFSYHAYTFPYTALESNPVLCQKTSGTLQRLFADRIVRAAEWARMPVERRIVGGKPVGVALEGEVDAGEEVNSYAALSQGSRRYLIFQADARKLDLPDECVDYVVTDPPYYDSVQYSDLSNFFRVWLKQLVPDDAAWSYDQQASAVFEGPNCEKERYLEAMTAIWKECARVLKKKEGRLVFTFHHWSPDAWADLTIALKRAGLFLVNRYVVFSENPLSVHIRNLKALKHDTILVLSLGGAESAGEIRTEPSAVNSASSEEFCRACGAALGWFLASDKAEERIRSEWRRLLKGVWNA